ncbi:hypothetical protein KPH14_007405 [Odynerus spinipes]|uniref:CHK kinase-like domain-containing protein n=1 Tax=Odynerus spinipes TaxID=1348599 RepID=A0AAD9RB16_9HYME|nr:hypothetical protein KPH14_007405 [Odynerus spinipes]
MAENIEIKIKEHFEKLIPKFARRLRDDFEKFEYELCSPNIFCVSNTFFINLKLWLKENANNKNDNSKNGIVSMRFFAKTAIMSEIVQRMTKLDVQFHNEIVFYQKYAKDDNCYPKCIYMDKSIPYESTLILEDVSLRGYAMHPKRIDVPLKDILVAMKEIARFHAKGYIMKERNPKEFSEILNEVKDSRFDSENDNVDDIENHFICLANMTSRAVDYLKKINHDAAVCEKFEKLFEDTYRNVLLKAIVPVEPLATLCHGDFTVNNVLFKRDADTVGGADSRAMLIDFAMLRYASPAIDLSTFLCLSCSKEDRTINFPKIMRTYRDELIGCLEKADIKNLERFSYEAMWNDYVRHGLYGFVIASFFLHILMGKLDLTLEELLAYDTREMVKISIACGGDEVSAILADMLLDLDKLGCVDAFL